jgi:hypothetical protein
VHIPDPLKGLEHISIGNFIFPFANSGVKIVAVMTICLLTWVNYRGAKNGGVLSNIVTAAKILGILLMIVLGCFIQTRRWQILQMQAHRFNFQIQPCSVRCLVLCLVHFGHTMAGPL